MDGYRWTKPSNFHITICFIGYIDEDQLGIIEEKLKLVEIPGFVLELDKIKPIMRRGKLDMIWVTFKENAGFESAYYIMHDILNVNTRYTPTPHLTLARVKYGFTRELKENDFPLVDHLNLEMNQFKLYESKSGHRGVEYVPLQNYLFT